MTWTWLMDVAPRLFRRERDFIGRDPQNWSVSLMQLLDVVNYSAPKKRKDEWKARARPACRTRNARQWVKV